jgi:very-short-patch-repair endonuclease
VKQWGNITRRQLLRLDFTRDEIVGMLRRSELLTVHRGVYALGHKSPAPEARWAAGLLAAGSGSALSHSGSAGAWGLIPARAVTEVTAPTRRRGDATLKVHHRQLDEEEVTTLRGLRVVTVARTLLDLAETGWKIDRLADEAVASRLVSLDDLRGYAETHRSARGGARLHAAVHRPHLRSPGERRLLAFLRRRNLPIPETNARFGRLSVDAYFPELRLAVELDHEQTHGTPWAIRRDAWRDRYLAARGIETLRIEEDDFNLLAAELERRRANG